MIDALGRKLIIGDIIAITNNLSYATIAIVIGQTKSGKIRYIFEFEDSKFKMTPYVNFRDVVKVKEEDLHEHPFFLTYGNLMNDLIDARARILK